MKKEQKQKLESINRLIRYWILDMTTKAGSGHPTSSLSAVEVMSTLFFDGRFRFDVDDPQHMCNDRLIFSKGHASPLFYALWAAAGAVDAKDLDAYRAFNSALEGHPTKQFPFTEAMTGSLGQGLSIGVGMAIAQKKLAHTTARTYVLLGDSEMAEGQVWEAMQIAQYYALDNLVAIVDVNRLGQRGETMLGHDVEQYVQRAKSFGWRAVVVDGHDITSLSRVFRDVVGDNKKPLMIIAKTYKGRGVSFLENKYSWHGVALSQEQFSEAIMQLGYVDFDVRGSIACADRVCEDQDQRALQDVNISNIEHIDQNKKYATRDGYGRALVQMMQEDERIIVLDAEVGNSTRAGVVKEYFPDRFLEMFIAEQNMISVAVGLALRGYYPFVSSFAAFLTRAHDQIRMAQYNDVSMTIVGSHAGVSIGPDGASQMGLEDIAMMRAMVHTTIFYPSDIVSTQQLCHAAVQQNGLCYIRTTREKTSLLYHMDDDVASSALRIIASSEKDRVAVIGSGITVHEALKAQKLLHSEHIDIRVIDLYQIHPMQSEDVKAAIDGISHVIVVEDHYRAGGIGDAVRAALCEEHNVHLCHLAVDRIPHSGTPEELLAYEKIDFNAIIEEVKHIIA